MEITTARRMCRSWGVEPVLRARCAARMNMSLALYRLMRAAAVRSGLFILGFLS